MYCHNLDTYVFDSIPLHVAIIALVVVTISVVTVVTKVTTAAASTSTCKTAAIGVILHRILHEDGVVRHAKFLLVAFA